MIRKVLLLVLPALLGVTILTAKTFDPDARIPADPKVRIGTLDNGMRYYIRHNAKPENQGEFYIFHNVGAIQEDENQMGLAHFLEHMAFNGTKNLPGKMMINYLESIGVKFGANLNAMTGQDYTVYLMGAVPLKREGIIDTALLVLHDWSHFIALEHEEIDSERGVIIEELRTGRTAARRVQEKNAKVLYNNNKYAYRNVIGYEDGLRTFKYQDIKDFYHKWYRPDLQTLVIVGDFDVDKMEAKIKKVMADIPAPTDKTPKVLVEDPGNKEPLVGIVTDPELAGSNVSYVVKHKPTPPEKKDLVSTWMRDNATTLITYMANQRLKEIAQQPNAPFLNASFYYGELNAGTNMVAAEASARNGELNKAFEALYTEVERIRRFGFNQSELDFVKANAIRSAEKAYDQRADRRSDKYVWGYINNFRYNAPMPSAEVEWKTDSMTISRIGLAYINALAAELLVHKNQAILIAAPEKEGVHTPTEKELLGTLNAVNAAELKPMKDSGGMRPLISKQLKPGTVKKTTNGYFGTTVWTLGNGAKVVLKPTDYKADEVLLTITAPGGIAMLDTKDVKSGSALKTLVELSGVGEFSAIDLPKQLAGKSAGLKLSINSYTNGFNGGASTKDIETLLQLTHLYFTEPRISKEAFNTMMGRLSSSLANNAKNPDFIMKDSVTNTIYGHNPRRSEFTIDNLGEVNFDRMMPIYKTLYGNADDFTFIFTGNFDPAQLKPLVEKYIGSLPATKSDRRFVDDGVRIVRGDVMNRFKTKMQNPKTSVNYVFSGNLEYSLKNQTAMEILRQIMIIRYTATIREEKGGTYGVRVSASTSKIPAQSYMMNIFFDTNPSMVDELTPIITEELESIATKGPKEVDLNKIKEFLIKQHTDDLKKNNVWAGFINTYYLNNIDMNTGYEDIVRNLTSADISKLAAKILKDNNVAKVIMDPVQ